MAGFECSLLEYKSLTRARYDECWIDEMLEQQFHLDDQ